MKQLLIYVIVTIAGSKLAAAPINVSGPAAPSASAAGNSFNPAFSADGRHLLFVSHANNLVTNDDLGLSLDVFVRDLGNSNTVLVSVSTNGFGGANVDANYPSISSNGQFVAFASRASNLVRGDANSASDVFLRDVVNGTTRLVSVDINGNSPIDPAPSLNIPLSGQPQISGDGRWVFFESRATNLVAVAAPLGSVNIYARDTWSNVTVLITMDTNGTPVGGKCELADITPDGRYALFIATNGGIALYDYSGVRSLYVRELPPATTALIHSNPDLPCVRAAIAAHGTNIVFSTESTAAPNSSNMVIRSGRPLSIVATNTTLTMSADGTRIAFEATGHVQLWIFNPFSEDYAQPVFSTNTSARPLLSRDGQSLAFVEATTPAATQWQIYRQHLATNYDLVSVSSLGTASAADFFFSGIAISPDGSLVAFDSTANDLGPGDLNGASDIFLRDVDAGATELITKAQPTKPAATAFAHSFLGLNSISADGRFVVALRYDEPSAFRDTNGWHDVFVSDVLNGRSAIVSISSNVYFTNMADGGLDSVFFIENTNAFQTPVISADGSAIYAARRSPDGRTRIYGAETTRAFSGAGVRLVSRGINVSENGNSYAPSAGSNGLLVVFSSTSSDLVPGVTDNNSTSDVILRHTTYLSNGLASASNELISVSISGPPGSGASSNGFISLDSRWVIFESTASDLTTNNTGSMPNLYARDLSSNITYLVAVGPNGNTQWGYVPGNAAISGNSRYVAFSSGNIYMMVHDLYTHTSVIADTPVARSPSLNYDGRFVAYVKKPSGATFDQIYIRDLQTTQIDLVSVNVSGSAGNGVSSNPLLSADGRYVVFQSKASDLVGQDTNGMTDIFVRDRLLGVTMVVSANAQGLPGNGPSSRPVIAADGRTVVFQSFANDLVTGDFNDKRDVFVLKLGSADSDGDGMDDDWEVAYFGNLSRDGSGDFDSDGQTDLQEFRAGTDPTNINSFFRVLTVAPLGGGNTRVLWTGNPARSYRVEFKDDLGADTWTPANGTISWNGETASTISATATNSVHRYYRVVRLP
jgi:Tol biopolymer transport system component